MEYKDSQFHQRNKLVILESIRGFAAGYVALGHLVISLFGGRSLVSLFFQFGKEAVIIFFLLSGFVIHFSNKHKESFRTYFVKRFRRIYGPLIIVFGISVIINFINTTPPENISLKELIGNLLMLQDFKGAQPGTWFNCFLGNAPLWSLSYEWWFYMLYFPTSRYVQQSKRMYFVFLFSAANWLIFLIVPNHITLVFSLYLLWWTGAELAELYLLKELKNMRKAVKLLVLNGLMLLLSLIPLLTYKEKLQFGYFPISNIRYFFAGLVFISGALIWNKFNWIGFNSLFGVFKRISPISFGIYIVHYPIFIILQLPVHNLFIEILIKTALIVAIAYLIEIVIQPYINKLLKVKKA